jgi:hypothetical protein
MASTIDLRRALNPNHLQASRAIELTKIVDFAEHNAGNGDTLKIFDIPAGFVREEQDVILLTAEGGAGTIDIGIEGATDSILDGGDVNGTVNTIIAKGTNAATVARTLFKSATTVSIIANAALDAAKILIVMRGYMTDVRA